MVEFHCIKMVKDEWLTPGEAREYKLKGVFLHLLKLGITKDLYRIYMTFMGK